MLVLQRHVGTSLWIGNNIRVSVFRIRDRSAVSIGIDAPRSMQVVRGELKDQWDPSLRGEPQLDARVTLIEDDPGHTELIRCALDECGIRNVTAYNNGEAAVNALGDATGAGDRPHVILMDLMLPGMSGLDAVRRLRQEGPCRQVPIVMLSSSDDSPQVQACLAAGANAFVAKEADYDRFRSAVGRIADFWTNVRTPD